MKYGDACGAILTERHVQAIWYDHDLRPIRLYTDGGECVRVVHPGEWNLASGPDFKGAVLEIGSQRRRLVGDVEVHLTPSDWESHGHGKDSAYGNVVAHVTWCEGNRPSSLPKTAVSIPLGRYFAADLGFAPESIDVAAYPFGRLPSEVRPCRRRADHDPECIRRVLARAGAWRLRAKAERLAGLLKGEDERQVFYSEVMAALGYSKNGNGFRTVAAAVPYSAVVAEPGNVVAAFRAAATFVEWNRDRVRPNSSPEVRLEAAARLFTETDVMALADTGNVSMSACKAMVATMTARGCVGRGRASAIVANVIIPFALACGHIDRVPDWLPPEDISVPVRRLSVRMFGGDHNPRIWYATNGLLIQGLIQIDREWCMRLHPDCTGCGTEAA